MYARLIGKKLAGSALTLVFVVVFNFFLFRVINDDPVGSLFRGSRVPQARLDQLRAEFGFDQSTWKQFLLYLRETAQLNFGLSYQTRQPVWDEITVEDLADRGAGGAVVAAVGAVRCDRRRDRRMAARERDRLLDHVVDDGLLLDAGLLARHAAAGGLRCRAAVVPGGWHGRPRRRPRLRRRTPRPVAPPRAAVPHAHARLPRRVRDHHALVDARGDG